MIYPRIIRDHGWHRVSVLIDDADLYRHPHWFATRDAAIELVSRITKARAINPELWERVDAYRLVRDALTSARRLSRSPSLSPVARMRCNGAAHRAQYRLLKILENV